MIQPQNLDSDRLSGLQLKKFTIETKNYGLNQVNDTKMNDQRPLHEVMRGKRSLPKGKIMFSTRHEYKIFAI